MRRPAEGDEHFSDTMLTSFYHQEWDRSDLVYDLVQEFATMLLTRTGANLDAWLTKAVASQIPEFQSFVLGGERDKPAVQAGLTRPESNGSLREKSTS